MDNVSKALIMAGGILLALLIISVSLYLLSSARGFASAINTNAELSAVESFNRYYQSFNSNITGIDLVNICNKVINDRNNGHEIDCNVRTNGVFDQLNALSNNADGDLSSLKTLNYSFTITSYDPDGYITYITIQ